MRKGGLVLLNCGVTVVRAVRKDRKAKSSKLLVMHRPILVQLSRMGSYDLGVKTMLTMRWQ